MSILDFKSKTISELTMSLIKGLADNQSQTLLSTVGSFAGQVKESGIFKECGDIYPLKQSEKNLDEFIKTLCANSKPTVTDYENYIESLRSFMPDILKNGSYWQPIFYTIASLLLCYCLYDMEVLAPETRDANLDKLAHRQVFGQLFVALERMNASQSERMYAPLLSVINKGKRTICEESFCVIKYYYIDLQGREHNNHNTVAERDKKAASYVEELCRSYQGTDMYSYLETVLFIGHDYTVFD